MLRVPAPLSRQCPPVPEPSRRAGAWCHRHAHAAIERLRGEHPSGAPEQRERERTKVSRVGWGDAEVPRQQHRGASRGNEDGGGVGGCHGPHPGPALRGSVLFIPRPAPGVGPEPPPRDPGLGGAVPVSGAHPRSCRGSSRGIPHGHSPGPHDGGPAPALSVHPPLTAPLSRPPPLHDQASGAAGPFPAPALPPADAHPPPTAPPLPGSAAHGPRRGSGGAARARSPLLAHGRPPPYGEGPARRAAPPSRGCGRTDGAGSGANRSPPAEPSRPLIRGMRDPLRAAGHR